MATAHHRGVEPAASFAAQFGDMRAHLPGAAYRPLADLRRASFDRFEALGFPTTRQEAWKYTNITRLANVEMALAPRAEVGVGEVLAVAAGGPRARRMIFVDGHFVPGLSHFENLPAGVRVASLASMLESEPDRVMATLAAADDGAAFTALNAAFSGAGAWIELDDGAALDEPLQLIFLGHGLERPVMSHPRLVVRLGKGARLRLIETYATTSDRQTLTNVVSQVDLAADAVLEHDRTQIMSPAATLLGKGFVTMADRSRLEQSTATLGGRVVRNEHMVDLKGSKIECRLNGLFMPHEREHVDNQIRIDHHAPDSHSDQFYKGVIAGRAHAVFAGKIFVHQPAQKTNAYQKNDNLLLSDDAEIDTKPELEIYADDVKCSHGATCGDLDPQALFYLRSRGLPAATAASLLTYSFAGEAIERFADPTVKTAIRKAALARLPGGAVLEVSPSLALARHPKAAVYDVEAVRTDFPILATKVNGRPLVYLDSAASAQKPQAVIDALAHFYANDYANIHRGMYELSQRASARHDEARRKVQRFIGAADWREVVFVRNATEGINLVAQSYLRPRLEPGDEILITAMEHHANIVPWQLVAEATGAKLVVAPVTDAGEIDLAAFRERLGPRTKMVAVVWISNVLGTVNPVRDLVRLAHEAGAPILLDAAQAVQHTPVDVAGLDCDFLVFSGHKLYGPSGVGVLWGKLEHLEAMPPYQGGGDMIDHVRFEGTTFNEVPFRFEAGTPDIAGIVALGAAIDYVEGLGIEAIAAHEAHVYAHATRALNQVPGLRLLGDAPQRASVLSFTIEGVHPQDLATMLDLDGVAIRTGHHCAEPLHTRFGLTGSARASLGLYTTTGEIDALVQSLGRATEMLR